MPQGGMNRTRLLLPALCLAIAGCDRTDPNPQGTFWSALQSHCGKAYAGKLVSKDEVDNDMRSASMVMHVAECSDTQINIPFHIGQPGEGWNRSRTWQFTKTDGGLRLKHRHAHSDGTLDEVTNYGGDTADNGDPRRQDFPADTESVALFRATGLDASVANTWTVIVDAADGEAEAPKFVYQLTRPTPNKRNFRAEFDLSKPIDPPPPPW